MYGVPPTYDLAQHEEGLVHGLGADHGLDEAAGQRGAGLVVP